MPRFTQRLRRLPEVKMVKKVKFPTANVCQVVLRGVWARTGWQLKTHVLVGFKVFRPRSWVCFFEQVCKGGWVISMCRIQTKQPPRAQNLHLPRGEELNKVLQGSDTSAHPVLYITVGRIVFVTYWS